MAQKPRKAQSQHGSLVCAMATRLGRARARAWAIAAALISSSTSPLLRNSAASVQASSSFLAVVDHGASNSKPRQLRAFSSSSSFSQTSQKPKGKVTDRLSSVIDAVNDRKLPPELRGQRNNVRSETDIINVVEQRIWRSMEEGQFENLPGKGKPLDLSVNPHADPAEDTLYRILSKNGCAPEWVELNKEVRNRIAEWRTALRKAWSFKGGQDDDDKWTQGSEALKLQLQDINDKVFRYNLIVPFGRQMFGLKWEKELDRLTETV